MGVAQRAKEAGASNAIRNTVMASKQIKVPSQILFIWLMLAGCIFFFAPERWTNKFQLVFAYVFRQPLGIGRNFSLSARLQPPFSDLISRSKYNTLQNHLANMIEWLSQERQKVEKLSGLRNRSVWEGTNFVLADVITTSIGGSHSRLIINRGEKDGLAQGQFVMGNSSVIGTISDVDSRTAQVKLITDPTSRMAVKIVRSSISATNRETKSQSEAPIIMQGNGDKTAKLGLMLAKHKIKIGYVVYAQKKPGFLETAMIVGTVAEAKRDPENPLLWDITVEPTCEIEKVNEVTVIVMNAKG